MNRKAEIKDENGFKAACNRMSLWQWILLAVFLATAISTVGWAYRQIYVNESEICENREMIEEMHDTLILVVNELEDLNEGQDEWMQKFYDLAIENHQGGDE